MPWETVPHYQDHVVTFLLGDVVDSCGHWEADRGGTAAAMELLNAVAHEVVSACSGHRPLQQGEGDNLVAAFADPADALWCASHLQARLWAMEWPSLTPLRMRLAVHSGQVITIPGIGYAGLGINRAARVRDLAGPGEVLVTGSTLALAGSLPRPMRAKDMGVHELRGLTRPEHVFRLRRAGAREPANRQPDVGRELQALG